MPDSQIKVTPVDRMGSDLTVVNAARVSFGKHSTHFAGRDAKLIKYLAEHNHISPFGHCFASFHVKAPIFVRSQLVKHKFLRVNEISRRYVDDPPEFYTPDNWRGRSEERKQGSEGAVEDQVYCNSDAEWSSLQAIGSYESLLEQGVAPEQARMVLPQSTMTEWYWSGSLDAFASMCILRMKEDAQYESRLVANQVSEYMSSWFPTSWEHLVTNKLKEEE